MAWYLGFHDAEGVFHRKYICEGTDNDDSVMLRQEEKEVQIEHGNKPYDYHPVFDYLPFKLSNEEYGKFKEENDYIEYHLRRF